MRLITFISAGVFIVCSAFIMKKEKQQATSLYETKWSLKKILTSTGIEEVQKKAFIKFDEEKKSAGGNGSCNNFGSSFTIHKNKIQFSAIFSTKIYCEDVQQTEDTFFNLLEKSNRFIITDKTLELFNDKVLLLAFVSE